MIDDFKGQDGRNPHAGRQERNAKVTSAEIEEATVFTGQVPEGQTAAECWRSSAKKVQDVVTDSRAILERGGIMLPVIDGPWTENPHGPAAGGHRRLGPLEDNPVWSKYSNTEAGQDLGS